MTYENILHLNRHEKDVVYLSEVNYVSTAIRDMYTANDALTTTFTSKQ